MWLGCTWPAGNAWGVSSELHQIAFAFEVGDQLRRFTSVLFGCLGIRAINKRCHLVFTKSRVDGPRGHLPCFIKDEWVEDQKIRSEK